MVLLPGFVSARIVRMMSAKTQQTELERVIEALIFSFFTYVFYVAVFGAFLPFDWSPVAANGSPHYNVTFYRWHLLSLAGIAILIGFGWGYIKGHDLLLRRLRSWKLTQRSSRESVWTDVFMNYGGTVQVGLGDGRSVIGWLKQYAESGDERTLFLERAIWVGESAEEVDVPGDGLLLLTEKSEIKYVMFLDEGQR
jgi:Family of unknown function (DUF6338)